MRTSRRSQESIILWCCQRYNNFYLKWETAKIELPWKNCQDKWWEWLWILESKKICKRNKSMNHTKKTILTPSLTITVVKCLRTVCEARTEQEPNTSHSLGLGSCKLLARVITHFEIVDGHLLISFTRAFPASLDHIKIFSQAYKKTVVVLSNAS